MVNYIKWPHYRKTVIYFPLYALNRHPVESQYADHIIFPNISFQQSLYSKTEIKYLYSSCLLMEWLSPEYTISCKDKYKTSQKTWWRQQQTGKPSFPPALQTVPSAPDKRRLNYTLEEQGGYFVRWSTRESLCDSFNAFQKQDYFLSCQTAGWMKDLFYHFLSSLYF